MRFQGLDLNLLVVLDLLVEHRSVTQAAHALHISQSAMSNALTRLRLFFKDDLLVSNGRGMVLTPKAEELAPAVREALMHIQSMIISPNCFDAATSRREFTIIASDYVLAVLLDPLMSAAARSAPHVRFHVFPYSITTMEQFARGNVDLAVLTNVVLSPDHPSRLLFQDEFKVICSHDNPFISERLSHEQFATLGHVATSLDTERPGSLVDILLRDAGMTRKIDIRVPTFSALAGAIAGTDRIAIVHGRLAAHFEAMFPVRVVALPFELPPVREYAQWHRRRNRDGGLEWLLRQVEYHGQDLAKASSP